MPVRLATISDLPGIAEIYADAVRLRSTAHTTAPSETAWKNWLLQHPAHQWPVFVSYLEQTITGWISFSPYRPGRQAFAHVAELSFYVHPQFRKQGIGGEMVSYALSTAPALGFKHLLCLILEWNLPSVQMVKKFGFELWGTMPQLAQFEIGKCSHLYYGLALLE